MIDEFMKWFARVEPDIDNVSLLLATELSNEPEALINDLTAIEVWNGRVGEMLSSANNWLDRSKKYYLPERQEGVTEGERKAVVENSTADIRRVRDLLESLSNSIKTRVSLGQSILKYLSIHAEFLVKERPVTQPRASGKWRT